MKLHQSFIRAKFLSLIPFVTLAACLTVGCSGEHIPTGTVTGTVQLDGKPYSDADVIFLSLDSGKGATGAVQADGSFTLSDPIPVGIYQIFLAPKAPPEGQDEPTPVKIDQSVPDKYWNESSTDLSTQITEGENTVLVELKKS